LISKTKKPNKIISDKSERKQGKQPRDLKERWKAKGKQHKATFEPTPTKLTKKKKKTA
jgi:hypothetical protein